MTSDLYAGGGNNKIEEYRNTAPKKSRNPTFDIMKGIGILTVIIGHLASSSVTFIYSFHMPLFFIVSGYFYRETRVKDSVSKDFRHLILPYLVTCAAIILSYGVISLYRHENQITDWIVASLYGSATLSHVSYYFAKVPRIGAIWFLLAMFWCKNLFNIIFPHVKHPFWVCLAISIVSVLINRYLINAPFALLIGFSTTIFYAMGYLVKLKGRFGKVNMFVSIGCVMIWIYSFLTSEMSVANALYENYPINVIGAYGGTYFIYLISDLLSTAKTAISSFLTWCGRNSLTILCLHLYEMDVPHLRNFLHVPDSLRIPFVLIFCVIGVYVLSKNSLTKKIFNISC